MAVILELRSLSKHFGPNRVVENVSLSVERGAFYALLGPSGCGKTTTLRLIAGFDQATEGDIFLNGERINRLRPYERNVRASTPVGDAFRSGLLMVRSARTRFNVTDTILPSLDTDP